MRRTEKMSWVGSKDWKGRQIKIKATVKDDDILLLIKNTKELSEVYCRITRDSEIGKENDQEPGIKIS